MANHKPKCTGCGKTVTVSVPDEEEGNQIAWECPDFECSTKNFLDGTTPVEMALERVGVTDEEGVRAVTDGDEATTGEAHA
jgi:hypothetical protein